MNQLHQDEYNKKIIKFYKFYTIICHATPAGIAIDNTCPKFNTVSKTVFSMLQYNTKQHKQHQLIQQVILGISYSKLM
jgi:hypothetical protein